MSDEMDIRDDGAWAENQRFVFAELRRQGRSIEKVDNTVDEINVKLAIIIDRARDVKEFEDRLKELEDKILERQMPKWMVALIIAVLASSLVPVLRAYLQTKGTPAP